MTAIPFIDFAQAQGPLRRHRQLAVWVLLAVSIALSAATIGWNVVLRERIQAETTQLQMLRRGPEIAPRTRQSATPALAAEVDAVNLVIRRLSIPWGKLFQAVEAAKSTRVFILTMKPDLQQRELRLSGESDDFPAVTEFIEALAKQPVLPQVHLTSHETRPSGRIHFEISAQWQP